MSGYLGVGAEEEIVLYVPAHGSRLERQMRAYEQAEREDGYGDYTCGHHTGEGDDIL